MSRLSEILRSHPATDPDPELPEGTPAAVLVPVIDLDPPTIIFTKRTQTVRDHKGEISFPGGVRHGEDPNLLTTALRETEEELGIPADAVEVLGNLTAVQTFVSGYVIAPFVGLFAESPPLIPSPIEIGEVIELEMGKMLAAEREVPVPGAPHATMWVCEVDGHVVWGATARILHELLEMVREGGWS
ncbi:MAG TPA: CoA pyrophosphatase [Actinomycetota bacterium]|nr:CoA pyrophosphatase [Actinomycetota bacterium]